MKASQNGGMTLLCSSGKGNVAKANVQFVVNSISVVTGCNSVTSLWSFQRWGIRWTPNLKSLDGSEVDPSFDIMKSRQQCQPVDGMVWYGTACYKASLQSEPWPIYLILKSPGRRKVSIRRRAAWSKVKWVPFWLPLPLLSLHLMTLPKTLPLPLTPAYATVTRHIFQKQTISPTSEFEKNIYSRIAL